MGRWVIGAREDAHLSMLTTKSTTIEQRDTEKRLFFVKKRYASLVCCLYYILPFFYFFKKGLTVKKGMVERFNVGCCVIRWKVCDRLKWPNWKSWQIDKSWGSLLCCPPATFCLISDFSSVTLTQSLCFSKALNFCVHSQRVIQF